MLKKLTFEYIPSDALTREEWDEVYSFMRSGAIDFLADRMAAMSWSCNSLGLIPWSVYEAWYNSKNNNHESTDD